MEESKRSDRRQITNEDEEVDDEFNAREATKIEEEIKQLKKNLRELLHQQENALDNLEDEENVKSLEKKITNIKKKLELKRERLALIRDEWIEPAYDRRQTMLFGRGTSTGTLQKHRAVVPSNLPKFRQGMNSVEPIEFMENLVKIFEAHEIEEDRYDVLLALCLDPVDQQWLTNWKNDNSRGTWNELKDGFIAHFQHPNAMVLWQDEILSLKMEQMGSVQRYTDQFLRLVKKLGWDLNSEIAIYQYKRGLPNWLIESLTASEAACEDNPGVERLSKMALKIEANRRHSKSQPLSSPTSTNKKSPATQKTQSSRRCYNCGAFGHLKEDCPKLKMTHSNYEKTEKNKNENRQENTQKYAQRSYANKSNDECHTCHKIGHHSYECPDRKVYTPKNKEVRAVNLDNQSNKSEEYDASMTVSDKNDESNCIEVPCTVNGERIIGLLDTGSNVSLINEELVQQCQWKITPQTGRITQAILGEDKQRIGEISNAEIKSGQNTVIGNLEVAKLSGDIKFIIGMDLFNKLGFQLHNIPFSWPENKKQIKPKKTEEIEEMVENDGIVDEWRDVIEDNLRLPVNSTCKLPDATLSIETGDVKPSWVRQYPIPQALINKVKDRVQLWKNNGWIVEAPINCQWNSPLLAAAKPAKEKGELDDIRLCLDARFVNEKITEVPDNKLPLLRDVLDKMGSFQWVTLIDLADSYHQFKLRVEDQEKTAFTVDGKQYMFTVVPFGLKIMTGHMQKIMEKLLGDLDVIPFQDDIAIASATREDHIHKVKLVLERLTYVGGLRIKLKKCKFFRTECKILGTMVSREGLRMDPNKIDAIVNWPRPMTGKAMQRFMGAANFHREFTHQFATIAAPLDECRNDKTIIWTPERIKAFEELKQLFNKMAAS